jgi:hypothetical protein
LKVDAIANAANTALDFRRFALIDASAGGGTSL